MILCKKVEKVVEFLAGYCARLKFVCVELDKISVSPFQNKLIFKNIGTSTFAGVNRQIKARNLIWSIFTAKCVATKAPILYCFVGKEDANN